MKQLKLSILLTLLLCMVGVKTFAYTCKVNGICYNLNSNNMTATVTYSGYPYNNDYTGHYGGSGLKGLDIIIPPTIIYNDMEYTVTSVGDKAFYDCESSILMSSITLPSTVTSIGSNAFWKCTALTSFTIPSNVTSIGSSAFYGCSGLTSVIIPNSVTSIGSSAFEGCSSLTNITIPNSVTSIGDHAFFGCGLTSIQVASGNTTYDSRNNCNAIIETASNTLIAGSNNTVIPNSVTSIGYGAFCNCSSLTSVTIPNSVTSIGGSTFEKCSSLTNVSIPNSVTSIGGSAFAACRSLMSVSIPNSVTSIGGSTFSGCSSLTSVTIPNSVTNIGSEAFWGCYSMTSVTIPNSVTNIGYSAFEDCSGLTSVTVERDTPVNIGKNTFSNRNNATLFVPYGRKAAYENADYWNEFKEIVEMSNDEPEDIEVTDISQMDNVIYIEPTEERTGTEATISFKMKNTAAIRGFQFDLVLPEGVTPVEEDGEYVYWLNADRAPKKAGGQFYHTLEVTKQADGSYRFLCGAQADKTFKGNDGEVAVMKVNIADDMKEGDYPIILRNIKLTETDISNYYQTDEVITKLTIVTYIPGDISGDGIVDVSDYIGVANHILGNTPAGFNARAADVNNDNVIDVSDYIGIANIILTGSIYGNNNAAARLMDKEGEQDPQ